MSLVVYYSSATGNTHNFVERLSVRALRIERKGEPLILNEPYVLVIPTYADNEGGGAVPKAVIHFLNHVGNRALIRAVVAGGNRNFGKMYALSGAVVARKCSVPCLYCFELRGTDDDVCRVRLRLNKFWKQQC
ncbi:MAG: protein involved in ribonucleotide reduction [Candidatus Tokpelaia sp. JSC189]|nr:MAG: protein involved in ribonucleotide reduction [Candidatus Tokpelaia sp. JSC189]